MNVPSIRFHFVSALLLGACTLMSAVADEPQPSAKAPAKCFEMRTYITHPGRLPALHKRFSEHTNGLFQKHGMTLVGYWTPTEGEEKETTLVYILAYPSREAREKSWQAFQADPVWKEAKANSEKDGPIVKKVETKFLEATSYSPIQ